VKATPENTAVVTILAYQTDAEIPPLCGFMFESARRMGIKPVVFMRGEKYEYVNKELDSSFTMKVIRFKPHVDSLPETVKYVLYVDARDVLFIRPLESICDEFNAIGWPILISGSNQCVHHIDPAWAARFGKHPNGLDYINAGCWMADRQALGVAFDRMLALSALVKDDKIASSHPPLFNNDQHMWQVAYVEHAFPLRVDYEQRLFNHFGQTRFSEYVINSNELKLKNGSSPCIVHFPGKSSDAMPYFAWAHQLAKFPLCPSISIKSN